MGGKSKIEQKDTTINRREIYCPDGTADLFKYDLGCDLNRTLGRHGIFTSVPAENDMFLHSFCIYRRETMQDLSNIRNIMNNSLTCTVIVPSDVILHAHKDFIFKSAGTINTLYLEDDLSNLDVASWIERLYGNNPFGTRTIDKNTINIPRCLFSEQSVENVKSIYRLYCNDPKKKVKDFDVLKSVMHGMRMKNTDFVYLNKTVLASSFTDRSTIKVDTSDADIQLQNLVQGDYFLRTCKNLGRNPESDRMVKALLEKDFDFIFDNIDTVKDFIDMMGESFRNIKARRLS